MRFGIDKITGFYSYSPVICILRNDKPFYANTLKNGKKVMEFNLPPGEYDLIEGSFKKFLKPLEYKLIDLPKSNNELKFPGKVKIYWRENPNKCSVDLSDKYLMKVYFDPSFRDMSDYVRTWVLGHELGHYIYRGRGQRSEKCCDHVSANLMLMNGFNPKQIDAAIKIAISNGYHALERKNELYENLLTVKPIKLWKPA